MRNKHIYPNPCDVRPVQEELESVVDGEVEEEEADQVEDEAEAEDCHESNELSLGDDAVEADGEDAGDESQERGALSRVKILVRLLPALNFSPNPSTYVCVYQMARLGLFSLQFYPTWIQTHVIRVVPD